MYFVLGRTRVAVDTTNESVAILGPEVVDAVLAVWHFVQREAANGSVFVATLSILLDLDGEISDKVPISSREPGHESLTGRHGNPSVTPIHKQLAGSFARACSKRVGLVSQVLGGSLMRLCVTALLLSMNGYMLIRRWCFLHLDSFDVQHRLAGVAGS